MSDFIRVKDKSTGHEYSIRERQFNEDAHTRLDNKSAYSASGEVAPPKFKTTVTKAAEKSGQKADTDKEKS